MPASVCLEGACLSFPHPPLLLPVLWVYFLVAITYETSFTGKHKIPSATLRCRSDFPQDCFSRQLYEDSSAVSGNLLVLAYIPRLQGFSYAHRELQIDMNGLLHGKWSKQFSLSQGCLQAIEMDPELAKGCWVDLGTGSGALALGIAKSIPNIKQVETKPTSDAPTPKVLGVSLA